MRYLMMNKPVGYITAMRDDARPCVADLLSDADKAGLFHVGRLDKDTSGLLLFTDDGAYNAKILNPKSNIKKTYRFTAMGELTDAVTERLCSGVVAGEGGRRFASRALSAVRLAVMRAGECPELLPNIPREKILATRLGDRIISIGEITVCEGRWHQVRRMLKAVGLTVTALERVSIGALTLDENLPYGEYRTLTREEADLALIN